MFSFILRALFKPSYRPKPKRFPKRVQKTSAHTSAHSISASARPRPSQVGQTLTSDSFDATTAQSVDLPRILTGTAYVTDGDTIRIQNTQVRLFGIDAPELHHPCGKKAKWAMVRLCKGHCIRAEITDEDEHGRTVAKCFLPDGRDLSEELVKQGLAIDWPKYSGGEYKHLEVAGIRKKLWLADARQKGRMHVWEKFDAQKKAKEQCDEK